MIPQAPPEPLQASQRTVNRSPPSDFAASLALKRTNLKKRGNPNDESKATEVQLCSSSEQYKQMMEETYMEQYLHLIQDFSFASTMLSLSRDAARALTDARAAWLAAGGHKGDTGSETLVKSEPVLMDLVKEIDRVKAQEGWEFIFVRLSSLSPKDGALNNPRFHSMYQEELSRLKGKEDDNPNSNNSEDDNPNSINSELNRRLHALYRASTWCLAMENGLRCCQILVEADRTYDDLAAHAAGKIEVDFNLVVREFRHFPVELEFRGFIHKRKLTALTQYNEFCFFPQLPEMKASIVQRIHDEFSRMLPKIPLDSFVVDFVLATDGRSEGDSNRDDKDRHLELPLSEYSVWIIELNPLAEFAGTGLFDWLKDKPVLLGRKEFEFRCQEKLPDPNLVLANMTPSWKERMGLAS